MIAMLGWVITDQRALRSEVNDLRNEARSLRNKVHAEFADLHERMASLEGLFEGFTKRDAAP